MYMFILIVATGLLALLSSYLPISAYIPVLIGAIAVVGFTIGIPVAIGIAILRHQLYDIDIIINRTLVYGILTASIAGLYVLVVVSLGTLFQAQGNLVISLFATGLIAVLFHPLRSRLQHGVNRLMYGERDDPYAVLSRLGRRLEATLAPEAVLPIIVETVAQALRLPYAAITLKQGDEFTTAAAYGIAREELVRLPRHTRGGRSDGVLSSGRPGRRLAGRNGLRGASSGRGRAGWMECAARFDRGCPSLDAPSWPGSAPARRHAGDSYR